MRNVVPKEGPRAPLFCGAVVLLLWANLANAQTVDVSTLEVCSALETEALKLVCFEAIISKRRTVATEVSPAEAVDVTQGFNKDLRFHLASGQVWRQIEPRHLQYPKNRDFEIEISQGMMGGYRMRIGENGRMVKIRRTQ
jgi:hypothetical protein